MACAIALPPVVESAGRAGREHAPGPSAPGRPGPSVHLGARGDGTARTPAAADPSPPGAHLSTAVRCGPPLSSPDGIEAQTCVVARGGEVSARTYYRNASGEARTVALSLMGPGGRTVLTHCFMDPGDDPALCRTPWQRERGGLARYIAVAEFTQSPYGVGTGRPLLRAGSN